MKDSHPFASATPGAGPSRVGQVSSSQGALHAPHSHSQRHTAVSPHPSQPLSRLSLQPHLHGDAGPAAQIAVPLSYFHSSIPFLGRRVDFKKRERENRVSRIGLEN